MGPVRILILAVALAAAIGAVVVVRGMSRAQAPAPVAAQPAAPAPKPAAMVLVAKRDLPPGTRLAATDLTWQSWPQESLNPAFIVQGAGKEPAKDETQKIAATAADIAKAAVGAPDDQAAALAGAVVREAILANEPVTERKLVRAGSAGVMAVALEPGMRAIAVPLSAETAAGGFILPGDHVDVVQSREAQAGGSDEKRYVSETVLKNVKVLAIDQTTAAPDGSAVVGATATLSLTPTQAEVLVLAKSQGQLTLVLRSYADIAGPPVTVASRGAMELPFRASVVRIYKNGQPTEVTVTR